MRVLVTGGAGFIGSHVVDLLLENGHDVSVVDNLVSGKEANVPKGAKFYKADIKDASALRKIFKNAKPEAVLHFAAQKSVTHSVKDPVYDAEENIIGTLTLAEVAREFGVKRFLFASTGGALYGETPSPAKEDWPALPESPYGIAKLAIEHYLRFYAGTHGFQATVLRLANVYGPRQDPQGEAGVMAIFCTRVRDDQPLTVYGDGKQTRDYVYVKDVARAFLSALEATDNLTVNIGTAIESSVLDLTSILAKVAGKTVRLNHEAPRPGELRRSVLDFTKAQQLLGWQPSYELEKGIEETHRSFVDGISAP
ncbi:MAG: NAD-dependent epimerase/dehydratase family protein [Candidatus Berkelbacteria bacterium]|nr:MAG: NAD-dependent epimerase/dehydratase family protein [Candidatus Berkelbacteria bacterium]QQG51696.1 MAG: NAD-dependent epimerase/dehydratase family protein [Candidatus Berkelbacteria bacterium]